MSRCYLCNAYTSCAPTPDGMFLCEQCSPRGNTATTVIEAALRCIADTSWSSAGDQRPKLAAALRAHFGEEEFTRRCDAIDREKSALQLTLDCSAPMAFVEALLGQWEVLLGIRREMFPPIEVKANPDNPQRIDFTYPHQPIGDDEVEYVGTFAPPDGAALYVEPIAEPCRECARTNCTEHKAP